MPPLYPCETGAEAEREGGEGQREQSAAIA
jgi:hypothetical protein